MTFERELDAMRESLASADHLTQGFRVIVCADHKNNIFTGSLLSNRRVDNKLLRWSLDIDDIGDRILRIWAKGADNVLGDGPSRNPKDRIWMNKLPVPSGPV